MDEEETTATGGTGDLRETVHGALGGLEGLVAKIPGFKGYKQKEMRREADKLLRMQIATQLDDQRQRLASLQTRLISHAQIEFLDDMERAALKLQILIDRIRNATYGYAGLFDAVKVKEEQLDALYEYDNEMMNYVGEIAADVDQVSSAVTAREGIAEAIDTLVDTVEQADTTFDHRHEVVLRAGGDY